MTDQLKPVAQVGSSNGIAWEGSVYQIIQKHNLKIGDCLYAIPPTHRVVSVELLEKAAKNLCISIFWKNREIGEELRAIIDSIP